MLPVSAAINDHGLDGFTISKGYDLLRLAFGLFAAVRNRTEVTAHRQQKRTDEARRQFRPPCGLRWPLILVCRPHSMSNESYLSFRSRPQPDLGGRCFRRLETAQRACRQMGGIIRSSSAGGLTASSLKAGLRGNSMNDGTTVRRRYALTTNSAITEPRIASPVSGRSAAIVL